MSVRHDYLLGTPGRVPCEKKSPIGPFWPVGLLESADKYWHAKDCVVVAVAEATWAKSGIQEEQIVFCPGRGKVDQLYTLTLQIPAGRRISTYKSEAMVLGRKKMCCLHWVGEEFLPQVEEFMYLEVLRGKWSRRSTGRLVQRLQCCRLCLSLLW